MNQEDMNEIVKLNNIQITDSSVIINDNITELEWAEALEYCEKTNKKLQWVIGELLNFGEKKKYRKYVELMSKTNFEYGTLRNIQSVAKKVDVSRRRDNLSFSHHIEVAALSPEKQTEFLDRAENEHLTRKELRNEIRKDRKEYIVKPVPTGVYNLVYCDPPWQYDFAETSNREVENHYPTMETIDICKMELPQLSFDCLLLMWATAPKIKEALKVIESWGFEYKTQAIWDKEIIGPGYWFRGQHEILLVATRGHFSPPEPENRVSSVYREKRTDHSKKPEYYYEWIEKSFPNTMKIELFARQKYNDNWACWGNEKM
jgi:N6-adenosine-specific RNA methylase IME4